MSEETSPPLQRILVALNASPHSQAALDTAVRLAEIFKAELKGVFIENERLLRAAQLPFAEEVRAYTTSPSRLSDRRVQRQLRYRAEYVEHTLQYAAEQAEVDYDFETVQGHVTRELLQAASEVDLLVLGKTSTTSSRRRLGSTSQTILADASSSVLVLREAVAPQQPILTYYDGSDAATDTLRLAVQLARRGDSQPLTVLLPPGNESETNRLRKALQAQYAAPDLPLHVHPLTPAESTRLSAFARRTNGLVILPDGCAPLANAPLKQFLYELDRPLLLMR
jgi:nucleotide-binding universal stress UspA family protein